MKGIKLLAVAILSLISTSVLAQKSDIIILAHRGGAGEGMENTFGSFKRTLDAGIRALEIDVRVTKDGKLVLQHDNTLKRTSGIDKPVEEMTEKELRAVTLTDGSKLLFLDEFLKLVGNYPELYIEFELKCRRYSDELLYGSNYLDKIAKSILKAQPKGSNYCITSFDTRALRYIKEHYPTIETGYITKKGCTPEEQAIAKALGAKRIAAHLYKTSREDMKMAHKNGFIVNLWPGHNDNSLLLAWALEADVHCTDYPIHLSEYGRKNCRWITIK